MLILNGKADLVTVWGICCSTWVSVNRGASGRNEFLPMGNPQQPSVRSANKLVSRPLDMK